MTNYEKIQKMDKCEMVEFLDSIWDKIHDELKNSKNEHPNSSEENLIYMWLNESVE